jgi:hypothetical protein
MQKKIKIRMASASRDSSVFRMPTASYFINNMDFQMMKAIKVRMVMSLAKGAPTCLVESSRASLMGGVKRNTARDIKRERQSLQ